MTIEIAADHLSEGSRLPHSWTEVVGAGRAAEALRADWQQQLGTVVERIGFRYLRFHGLFHDDMFVYHELDGKVVPYFQYVDTAFDHLLQAGIRPFVELGFSPGELAREKATVFWWGAHGSPPTDLTKWAALVSACVQHWVERYGIEEVRQWYFEVWNEANLGPFFRGTRSEYLELYRVSAGAVKAVDSALRVGGPATSNFVPDGRFAGETEDTDQHAVVLTADDLGVLDWRPVWLEEFLAFCVAEGLPVDFVSCHPYPTDWALDEHGQGERLTRPVDATPADLRRLRGMVDASPFPDAEIHLTEWNSSSSSRDFTHDYLQAATYVVKANLESIGLVDSLSFWTFTDIFEEEGAGYGPFHGGFGMINQHGISKPTFHGYRMLAALGDELLTQVDGGVVTRDSTDGSLAALVYHYPEQVHLSVPASFDTRDVAEATLAQGDPRELRLVLTGVGPGQEFELELLDAGHGNAVAAWQAEGEPLNLTRDQRDRVAAAAEATYRAVLTTDVNGTLTVNRTLEPWSLLLLRQVRSR